MVVEPQAGGRVKVSIDDYYFAANEVHRWVQNLEEAFGGEVKQGTSVYSALCLIRDVCLEDIDAAGTEAVLENQRLRTENSALKQRLYYLKQLLDEGEEPHG
jgi:hypothetical protein